MIVGSCEPGWISCELPCAPIEKSIVPPVAALASVIAWRNEPGPESLVVVTVNVVVARAPAGTSARPSADSTTDSAARPRLVNSHGKSE